MDLDDQQCFVQPALELVVVPFELRNLQRIGAACIVLGSSLDGRQGGQVGGLALASPGAQGGGVHALATHQRADLAGLGASVRGLQNAALVSVGKTAPTCAGHDFGIGGFWPGQLGGILRCVHLGLGLNIDRHTYLGTH